MPFPAPLHEGMPIDLYEKYVAPPPPNEEDAAALEVFISSMCDQRLLQALRDEIMLNMMN